MNPLIKLNLFWVQSVWNILGAGDFKWADYCNLHTKIDCDLVTLKD